MHAANRVGWMAQGRLDRPTRVLAMLSAVIVLSFADLYFTFIFMTAAGMPEMNPVVRALAEVCDRGSAIVIWKVATLGVCVGLLYIVRRTRTGELGALLAVMVLVWLTARWGTFIDTTDSLVPFLAEFQATDAEWVMLGSVN